MIVINIGNIDFYDTRSKQWFLVGKEVQVTEEMDTTNIDKYLEREIIKIKEDKENDTD